MTLNGTRNTFETFWLLELRIEIECFFEQLLCVVLKKRSYAPTNVTRMLLRLKLLPEPIKPNTAIEIELLAPLGSLQVEDASRFRPGEKCVRPPLCLKAVGTRERIDSVPYALSRVDHFTAPEVMPRINCREKTR